jgi:transposase
MVDLTRGQDGKTRARLIGLVPGRSGKTFTAWLDRRSDQFKQGVKTAALDPFRGCKRAIDEELDVECSRKNEHSTP